MSLFTRALVSSALLTLTTMAFAKDGSVFTTIAFPSDKTSYVAIKKMAKGDEPLSTILEIRADKMISKKISLPTDLQHREIISIIPAKGNKLLVLTQYTMERGDHPRLHAFDPVKKTWTSVGEVACISFAKLKIDSDKLVFSCEEANEKGDISIVAKDLKIAPFAPLTTEEIQLPIAKLEKGVLKAQFEGLPQEWEKLKLKYKEKEKTFVP